MWQFIGAFSTIFAAFMVGFAFHHAQPGASALEVLLVAAIWSLIMVFFGRPILRAIHNHSEETKAFAVSRGAYAH